MFGTREVRTNECVSEQEIRCHNRNIFSIFNNRKVCFVFSLELPYRGDSNGYTQHTIINIKKENRS